MTRPLLGADFLHSNSLLVDLKGSRLVDAETYHSTQLRPTTTPAPHLGAISRSTDKFNKLLVEFPSITTSNFTQGPNSHGVKHHISTKGPLFLPTHVAYPRHWQSPKQSLIKWRLWASCKDHLGPWASPLYMVPKESSSWRPCSDYRRLNDIITTDQYPVPHLQDFMSNLAGKTAFSKVDIVRGYHQIPVAQEDISKTAITTSIGLYQFLWMPKECSSDFPETHGHSMLGIAVYLCIHASGEPRHGESQAASLTTLSAASRQWSGG